MTRSGNPRSPIVKSREAMLALVEQVAKVGHWWLAVPDGDLRWSGEIYRIHDVDPEVFTPTLEGAFALYHPDDVERARDVLDRALATGEPFDFDLRVVTRDDEIRHLFCRGVSERDGDGRVDALFGTLMDITALKLAEQASRESERRFRLLAESTSDVITRHDANFQREYVSPACARLFGYSPEEMLGLIPSETIHADDREGDRAAAKLLIGGGASENRITST